MTQLYPGRGLPLTPYEREPGQTNDIDHAASAIIDLGNNLGMEMEVTGRNHNKLDLTGY